MKKNYFQKSAKKIVKSYTEPLIINARSYFNKNTILGSNSNFNGMRIVGEGTVTIGNNFHSGSECQIITQNHNYEGETIPYDKSYIYKNITIEDNVWVGNRVRIPGNVTIGEGAIIQAGSVVGSDIPKYAIASGNPATVYKYRDIDKYEKLKSEGKFP